METQLNQRLSHGIYQGLAEIHRTEDGRFTLAPEGEVVEIAVKMRQLPEEHSLKSLLNHGKLAADGIRILGAVLAEFYRTGLRSPHIDHFGQKDVIQTNMEENFRQAAPFVGRLLDPERWEFTRQVSRTFLTDKEDLFRFRLNDGRIRDGHGDLRAEHIYFDPDVQIIDCIEFNERFRYGDAALDLAFLHMDLEHLGFPETSRALLSEYGTRARDYGLYAVLDFYAAYRSMVRLKISCFRYDQTSGSERSRQAKEAERFMNQAYRYALQFGRPALWIFCGLPATGKSTLAEKAARALHIDLLQTDRIRKEQDPDADESVLPFGQGLYHPIMRQRVYGRLLNQAQESLKHGRSVILDATFGHEKWRDEARRLARDLDTSILFIECVCPDETIRNRLGQRESEPGISDARLTNFPQIKKDHEPFIELPGEVHLVVRTDQPLDAAFIQLLDESHARFSTQVRALL